VLQASRCGWVGVVNNKSILAVRTCGQGTTFSAPELQ